MVTTGGNLMRDIKLYYLQKDRERLVKHYGEEKVAWAEQLLSEDDYRDEMDRNYP